MSYRIKGLTQDDLNDKVALAERNGYKLIREGSSYIKRDTLQFWAILEK
jgi:hypothetical protein